MPIFHKILQLHKYLRRILAFKTSYSRTILFRNMLQTGFNLSLPHQILPHLRIILIDWLIAHHALHNTHHNKISNITILWGVSINMILDQLTIPSIISYKLEIRCKQAVHNLSTHYTASGTTFENQRLLDWNCGLLWQNPWFRHATPFTFALATGFIAASLPFGCHCLMPRRPGFR